MENILDGYLDTIENCKSKLQESIFINKEILAKQIVQAFDRLYQKIIMEQSSENKGKIQAINISLLKVGFKTREVNCIIEAFDEKWLFDNKPITYSFKLDKIFDEFYTLEDYLKEETKKYFGKSLKEQIEKNVLEQYEIAIYYFIELVRYSIEDILENEKFKLINKEEKFCIVAGEYRDKGLIVYAENNTYEDQNSSIIHMDKMKTLRGGCFKRLHFQDKKYLYHDLIGNIFNESIFENVELTKCALSQTSFKNCSLKNISFEGSILHDTFFNYSNIENANFRKVYSHNIYDGSKTILTGCIGLQFLNTKIKDSTFKNSIINGSDFRYASLENIDFTECELKQADFRESALINVDFTDVDLKDAYFNEEQLSDICLSDEQLKSIHLM